MTKGWRYESSRHSLASRGIKTKSRTRRVLETTGAAIRGEIRGKIPISNMDPEDLRESVKLAEMYYDANKGSIAMALANADRNQMVLKREYKTIKDPDIKREMDINKAAHSILLMMKDKDGLSWRFPWI